MKITNVETGIGTRGPYLSMLIDGKPISFNSETVKRTLLDINVLVAPFDSDAFEGRTVEIAGRTFDNAVVDPRLALVVRDFLYTEVDRA